VVVVVIDDVRVHLLPPPSNCVLHMVSVLAARLSVFSGNRDDKDHRSACVYQVRVRVAERTKTTLAPSFLGALAGPLCV
jgi:hypothetical protein